MSSLRSFAQRNNNVSKLTPKYAGILPNITDLSGCAVYALTLPNVQSVGGIFYVDLSGNDASGNLLNLGGQIYSPINSAYVYNVNFVLDIPTPASFYPGLEFTIFFKNIPFNRLDGPPLLSIGLMPQTGAPIPYILSPPFPSTLGPNINPSITLKSDSTNFNVSSSGPAGWLGLPVLIAIISYYGEIGP